ncbi:M20 family metallopeptidase [Marinilactibacillus psychrotolerans]|uniref:Dipeptidase PepV n=1 Tax=Marinilactibacillus psychrotolerans TaxID=191770 RepID=A0AAV3WY42_9LACT|nr:M20 family metallopeptidase [Marinilactibacillus psychrotolerans]GEL66399.1 putative Xaa-His dipeptidase [Marinilactibacillus psychrotolerans]GEQ36721.1 dipeptidase PepV [Marinilactibacillus psychrotolerans]SDD16534.1 dipeptidase, putative [Marinilactibacillus psychrotolerans]
MKKYVTEAIKKESLVALERLVNIPSYNTPVESKQGGLPFGKGIDLVLKEALQLCEELGMQTYYDPEGYYGYADYGEGKETVGILCHLDVVPEGDAAKWNTAPFEATELDGVIYGRGTQDDKGPTIATLYAFKALVDAGETFNRKLRFVFGTDEESLWRGMDKYKKFEDIPDVGFVPDSAFPLTYAEKGLLQFKLIGRGSDKVKLDCPGAPNVVPATATYKGDEKELLAKAFSKAGNQYELTDEQITVHGKAVHASTAFEGVNAINLLAAQLVSFQSHPTISFLAEKVDTETNGFSIFGKISDAISGELTFNVASLSIDENQSEVMIDMRIPVSFTSIELVKQLKEVAGNYGLKFQKFDELPSLYVPKESSLVKTLMDIYKEKTGDLKEPMTSGGATYARSMPNMVAFGAHFPGSPSLAHQENEGIIVEELYKAMDIYAEAIYQLCCKTSLE